MALLPGISPPVGVSQQYGAMIIRSLIKPIYDKLNLDAGLYEIERSRDEYYEYIDKLPDDPLVLAARRTAGTAIARRVMERLQRRHARRFYQTVRRHLTVSIHDLIRAAEPGTPGGIFHARYQKILTDNIDLITRLSDQERDRLKARLVKKMFSQGYEFDRASIRREVMKGYRISSRRARLIARDQVSKSIGALNGLRQTHVGIEEYQWRAINDSRLRKTHRDNMGKIFRWDKPPDTGHPGHEVQCRCSALGVIPGATYRFAGTGRPGSFPPTSYPVPTP